MSTTTPSDRYTSLRREINRCNAELLTLIREPRTASIRAQIATLEEQRSICLRQIVTL